MNFRFTELPYPRYSEETKACIRLWRRVIDKAVDDVINPRLKQFQSDALYWLQGGRTFFEEEEEIEAGFYTVVDLAELNLEKTQQIIQELLNKRGIEYSWQQFYKHASWRI